MTDMAMEHDKETLGESPAGGRSEGASECRGEILVVDDSLSSLRLLSLILVQAGYRVREAASGELALWTLNTRPPDLVLLDVRMPGMDGFEVCRRIKSNPQFAALPVIFLSAQGESTDKVQGLALGAVDFVSKSSEHEEILARIDTHVTLARVKGALELERANLEHKVILRTAELLQGKSLLRSVIDSGPDLIYAIDRNWQVLLVNQNMAKGLGGDPVPELIGRYYCQLFSRDTCGTESCRKEVCAHDCPLHQDDRRVFAGENIHRISESLTLADGQQRMFETYKTPLRDQEGLIYGLLCYRRDITERLRLEGERRALEKALWQARKMEVVGQLAGGIAHDFNNQLSLILGFAQFATRALASGKFEKLDEYLSEILKAGTSAQGVVAQLLAYSRVDQVATTAIQLAPVVEESLSGVLPSLTASVTLKREIAPDLPNVTIGAVQVRQLITNLIINARDALAGSGTVTVRLERGDAVAPRVCASCRQSFAGAHVVLSVSDTGTGMPTDVQERIFDPFFTTKDVGKGSGLGLAMVHGITHTAAGHVGLLSVPGQGTEVSIYLPVNDEGGGQ